MMMERRSPTRSPARSSMKKASTRSLILFLTILIKQPPLLTAFSSSRSSHNSNPSSTRSFPRVRRKWVQRTSSPRKIRCVLNRCREECRTFLYSVLDNGRGSENNSTTVVMDSTSSSLASGAPISQHSFEVADPLLKSIERVRERHFSHGTEGGRGEAIHKRIVRVGLDWNKQRNHYFGEDTPRSDSLSSSSERVPGCIASVHINTTLLPASSHISTSSTGQSTNPDHYRVVVDGTSDALLSGGLLALLSDVLSGGTDNQHHISAAHVLQLDPTILTSAIGLQLVLSRGRNDGTASMVKVVQNQIRSLLLEGESAYSETKATVEPIMVDAINMGEEPYRPKVAMLLSGGVDSSVALHLLIRQNYNVTAFYLRIWLEDELAHLGECPWEDDMKVCQAVCEHAGNIPLRTVSLGAEYKDRVIQYTIEEARQGRTPNPDIMCNSRVKFGCFLEYIERNGAEFDHVASGHYARLEEASASKTSQTRMRLFRAPDPVKDQSYFLCALTQEQLSKILFPIGIYHKSEVRELAAQFQLPNRRRPDSQGLCFLGKVRFDDFLSSYLGRCPGDIVDALSGEVIGHHNGLWYHTVGQRKGIGKVIYPVATAKGPWYVVAKNQERNVVFVSNRYDEDDFSRARSEFEVEDVRWLAGMPPREFLDDTIGARKEQQLDMKIRHGPSIVRGALSLTGDGSTGNIRLGNKDGGLAPGQYVVFYRRGSDECLGAGIISETHWANFIRDYDEMMATTL